MKRSRPILFSTDMVQAILSRGKTQTRRLVTPSRSGPCATSKKSLLEWDTIYPNNPYGIKLPIKHGVVSGKHSTRDTIHRVYPPCEIGDKYWVRETFYAVGYWATDGWTKTWRLKYKFIDLTLRDGHQYIYKADKTAVFIEKQFSRTVGWYKRNSIFMPRAASRITLEITEIRVERLLKINRFDVKREGFSHLLEFGVKWVKLHGIDSWDNNPFVWVLTFKRIKP